MENQYFYARKVCLVCGNENFNELYSLSYNDPKLIKYLNDFYNPQGCVEFEYLKDAEYSLQECNNCNLIFQRYIPNDFLMEKLYEHWINPQLSLERSNNSDLIYFRNISYELINIISHFKTSPGNLSFLDFGMGWGKWSIMAKAFGVDTYGIELSKERIKQAKKNGINILNLSDIPNNTFDFINTDSVFEHIPEPLETLKQLVQSLKANGVIKINVPNGNWAAKVLKIMNWDIQKGSENSLNIVAPLEHINCFRTKTLKTLAKECDLEQVRLKYKHYHSVKEITKEIIRPFYTKFIRGVKNIKDAKEGTYLFFKKVS